MYVVLIFNRHLERPMSVAGTGRMTKSCLGSCNIWSGFILQRCLLEFFRNISGSILLLLPLCLWLAIGILDSYLLGSILTTALRSGRGSFISFLLQLFDLFLSFFDVL